MKISFRVHALKRLFERGISLDDVRAVLTSGQISADYPDDQPYPGRLLLGWSGARPIHVVAGYNAGEDETIVVTAYEPDPTRWDSDYMTRKKP